ncbi:MAG TPA: PIN domain-containing protein [Planctomycetota bacterium]|jgi:predicted nucleic acid-binding protein
MTKPSVYLDTNIVSALVYDGRDSAAIARTLATWEWWEHERQFFNVYTSSFAEGELEQGKFRGQTAALKIVHRITYLPGTATVRDIAKHFLEHGIVPLSQPGDANHLAFACAHGIDYLLSWNHSHLANDVTQRKLEIANEQLGLRTPLLRSPLTIPRATLGQVIRREV